MGLISFSLMMLHSPLVMDGSKVFKKGNDLYRVTWLFMAKNLLTF